MREEPLTKRERSELQGYVAWTTTAGRVLLFSVAVAAIGGLCWRVQSWSGAAGAWWLAPTAGFAVGLWMRADRWTGGRALRACIRRDLEAGVALVHSLRIQNAIEVREEEDEGPTYFVELDSGETVAFGGQYLYRHVRAGFPWRELEIRETPHSGRFLGLRRKGEPVPPSLVLPPLGLDTRRLIGLGWEPWKPLAVDFESLRRLA